MKKSIHTLLFLLGVCRVAGAQNAVPDATFGSGTPAGTAVFSGTSAGTFDQGIAIQTDGKILVSSGTNVGMARLNVTGAIDNTFGGGWVSAGQFAFGDIVVQADGNILTVGEPTVISHGDLYIWRLKPNGTFDNSFGQSGRAGDSSLGSGYGHIAIQSGNKIIWSGALGLKRLNLTDGSPDAGFGNSGFVRTTQLPLFPAALAVDNTTGNILLGGYTKVGAHLALIRLTPNGQPDATFGTNGVDSLSIKSTGLTPVMNIGINSAGKIIMVSDYDNGASNSIVCVGFNANGSVDNTFGTNAITYPAWNTSGGYQFNGGMAIAGNDKIFIAATVNDNGVPANGNDIAIQRLNANGSADAAFGVAKLDLNHASDNIQAIVVQTDGKLVINGSTAGNELVARYTTGTTGIQETEKGLSKLLLYPGPVQSSATFSFAANEPATVSARIYATDGRQAAVILDHVKLAAGVFKKVITTKSLAPGMYQIVVEAGHTTQRLAFQQL